MHVHVPIVPYIDHATFIIIYYIKKKLGWNDTAPLKFESILLQFNIFNWMDFDAFV